MASETVPQMAEMRKTMMWGMMSRMTARYHEMRMLPASQ